MLAFHPVKMQSCYEKVEQLSLEGLQQRFDVSSPSVFVQRAQILMREVRPEAWARCLDVLVSVAVVSTLTATRRSSSSRRRVNHPSAVSVWVVFNLSSQ